MRMASSMILASCSSHGVLSVTNSCACFSSARACMHTDIRRDRHVHHVCSACNKRENTHTKRGPTGGHELLHKCETECFRGAFTSSDTSSSNTSKEVSLPSSPPRVHTSSARPPFDLKAAGTCTPDCTCSPFASSPSSPAPFPCMCPSGRCCSLL